MGSKHCLVIGHFLWERKGEMEGQLRSQRAKPRAVRKQFPQSNTEPWRVPAYAWPHFRTAVASVSCVPPFPPFQ